MKIIYQGLILKSFLPFELEHLDLVPATLRYPSSQPMLVAGCRYHFLLVYFHIGHDSFGLNLMDLMEPFQILPNCPDFNGTVASSTGKNIALLDGVQSTDPIFMGISHSKDRFLLLRRPKENSSILGCSQKLLLIDGTDPVYCIVVPFVYDLCLFLSFPDDGLMIISRT